MGSSPGFVSTPGYSGHVSVTCALFRLGFPTAPAVPALTSQPRVTRWFILQKARRRTASLKSMVLRPLVDAWFQILFHSPHRGAFHLSLTVLLHYRSSNVFSLGEWTPLLPTGLACPAVLRIPDGAVSLSLTGLLPSLVGFPTPFC